MNPKLWHRILRLGFKAVSVLVMLTLLVPASPLPPVRVTLAANWTFPGGCAGAVTLQECLTNVAANGDTIFIQPGTYNESLTLDKAVSLVAQTTSPTQLQALAGQRVITVTGAVISNSVVISGLTLFGGSIDYGGGM